MGRGSLVCSHIGAFVELMVKGSHQDGHILAHDAAEVYGALLNSLLVAASPAHRPHLQSDAEML